MNTFLLVYIIVAAVMLAAATAKLIYDIVRDVKAARAKKVNSHPDREN